ncbi:MAG TPA: transglycosylase SLT domain-containing protein [Bdellovibrionota bacterium]|nr:transglycosylase SLT domain-containing protein [Bdellovibrionota bacterium]
MRIANIKILASIVLLFGGFSETASAHHLLEEHPLASDPAFPCPKEIARRVDFWVDVFHKFGTDQVVFHDTDQPHRVYSVLTSTASCTRRREPAAIKNERQRIRTILLSIADRWGSGNNWNEDELHFVGLFDGATPQEIRDAADNIRCQQGNRDRFLEGLRRYGAYRDLITAALREAKLPEDIQYLPFVESSYDPRAYSRVGAAGLWQIMPRTARLLGLKLNDTIDERFDPILATKGAIRYFKDSYDEMHAIVEASFTEKNDVSLGPFVITSYNYGTVGMRRALKQIGPDYIKVLTDYSGRRFRTAVKNFYSTFLAARHVAKYAQMYFPGVHYDPPLSYETGRMSQAVSVQRLSDHLGLDPQTIKELNPSLTRRVWKGRRLIPKDYELRLPKSGKNWDVLVASLNALPAEQLEFSAESYRVERGDTPCGIARTFGVSCADFIDANDLGHRPMVRIGQIVSVPGKKPQPAPASAGTVVAAVATPNPTPSPSPSPAAQVAALEPSIPQTAPLSTEEIGETFGIDEDLFVTEKKEKDKTIYTIRIEAEETLGHFAEWLKLSRTQPLRTLNGIKSSKDVLIGQEIRIPVRNDEEKKEFERQRIEYHQVLETEFHQHYNIVGEEEYELKAGDSVWTISKDQETPIWLLKRLNPKIFSTPPHAGVKIRLPLLEEKKPTNGTNDLAPSPIPAPEASP